MNTRKAYNFSWQSVICIVFQSLFEVKMSWMADEWKSDLSHRALQKVEQLEGQLERFKKEAEIKQFKIDSIEQVTTYIHTVDLAK